MKNKFLKIIIIVLIICLSIFALIFLINKLTASKIDKPSDQSVNYRTSPYITNPSYLQDTENILVDSEGKIASDEAFFRSIDAFGGKRVWVERIVSNTEVFPPTFLVSYVFSNAGEKIISFSNTILKSIIIEHYPMPPYNSVCSKKLMIDILKTLVIGKEVIVTNDSGSDFLLRKQDVPASLLKGVTINSSCTSKGYSSKGYSYMQKICFSDKSDMVSVREILVVNGYSVDPYLSLLGNPEEVAKLAKKGAWEQCEQ